jgi:hypothetical protein
MAKEELLQPIEQEADLLAIIDEELTSGISFENDLTSSHDRTDAPRDVALEYYRGVMKDLPADPDWSHAVSRDVANTIDFMLPGLMRVFAGAGQIVKYDPAKQGDEKFAAQATDYVNYLWDNELNGYLVLFTAIHDALTVRNGIIKVYWDPTPEYENEDWTGISDTALAFFMQTNPDVQVSITNEVPQLLPDPMTGQMVQTMLYDVRIKRVSRSGRLRLVGVPPEDFGISALATTPDEARACWHYARKTRSDLVREGYPREVVDEMPAWTQNPSRTVDRENDPIFSNAPTGNHSMQQVDTYEVYMMYDADGDGIAERCKIVVCGATGARKLLSLEPWPDDVPFVDLKPHPVPHRWEGRSIADDTADLQRIKTALLRQMLDNLYLVNRPQREVVESQIIDSDEVLNPKIAGVIRVKSANAVQNLDVPYIGDKAMQGLNYIDGIIKQRTGSSMATAALDATALDPQTATAEQIEHDQSYSRVELIARNIAELGLKKLFAKILRILVRNQDEARMIQLRGTWVPMTPGDWNANMHASINVGLGTGSRERDLAMLGGIQKQQAQIVQELGPMNPVVPPSKYVNTLHKMVEAAGLRNADQYFTPITDDQFAQWQQSQQPKPDPKAQEAQARTQIAGQSAQAKAQLEGQKGQAQLQLQHQKAASDIQLKRDKMAADVQIAREKARLDYAEGLQELAMEERLKELEIKQPGREPGETELRRPN